MPTLEERMKGSDREQLLRGIENPTTITNTLYQHIDFYDTFTDYCSRRNITFANGTRRDAAARLIGNHLHKKALEPVFYGMKKTGNVPSSIISKLEPWEAAYFFAGMNSLDPKYNSNIPDFSKDQDADTMIARIILRGMDLIARRHEKAKTELPKHLNKPITSTLTLPYETEIRKYCSDILWRQPKPIPSPQKDLFI